MRKIPAEILVVEGECGRGQLSSPPTESCGVDVSPDPASPATPWALTDQRVLSSGCGASGGGGRGGDLVQSRCSQNDDSQTPRDFTLHFYEVKSKFACSHVVCIFHLRREQVLSTTPPPHHPTHTLGGCPPSAPLLSAHP